MFTQRLVQKSRVIVPIVGILVTNNKDAAQCHKADKNTTNDNNNNLFEGQCLQRQVYTPRVPYPAWDYNWDGRMTSNTTLQALLSRNNAVPGKTRHLIFIRHGQYDETYANDEKRVLTKLGRIQAHCTGQRLAILLQGFPENKFGPCRIRAIYSSDMVRAKETATIIAKYLPNVPYKKPDSMLNEALPAPIIPVRPEIENADTEIDENASRMDAAFHKYMYRAPPQKEEEHEFIIIVGHGNVIRYMFCRALQLPPEAWLRMSIFNCSMTYLMVKPNGYCVCRMLGDIGHLGYEHTTFSSGHGFVWS